MQSLCCIYDLGSDMLDFKKGDGKLTALKLSRDSFGEKQNKTQKQNQMNENQVIGLFSKQICFRQLKESN